MAKQVPAEEASVQQEADAVTLEEFCLRLSSADRRVEMIGAFCSDERRSGRVKDAEGAYSARYQAFLNKPA